MITGKIVRIDQDENGALRVWANYKIDGVDVPSKYQPIENQAVFCTRYDAIQLQGIDDAKAYILDQSQQFVNQLIRMQYSGKANADLVDSLSADLIGQTVSSDEVTVDISPTQQVKIKQDGTKGEVTAKPVLTNLETGKIGA